VTYSSNLRSRVSSLSVGPRKKKIDTHHKEKTIDERGEPLRLQGKSVDTREEDRRILVDKALPLKRGRQNKGECLRQCAGKKILGTRIKEFEILPGVELRGAIFKSESMVTFFRILRFRARYNGGGRTTASARGKTRRRGKKLRKNKRVRGHNKV